MNNKKLFEGLEAGDLKRLIHPELHVDEFRSKLGDDQDICVVSFKVRGKEPARDLVNFVEKGYPWVVDADVSSGEMDDGDYIVFVEIERDKTIPRHVIEMMEDIMRLTEQELGEWRVRYHTSNKDHELDVETLTKMVPLSADEYNEKYGKEEEPEEEEEAPVEAPVEEVPAPAEVPAEVPAAVQESLDRMRAQAGIKVTTRAPKNSYTESLRIAAGIR